MACVYSIYVSTHLGPVINCHIVMVERVDGKEFSSGIFLLELYFNIDNGRGTET